MICRRVATHRLTGPFWGPSGVSGLAANAWGMSRLLWNTSRMLQIRASKGSTPAFSHGKLCHPRGLPSPRRLHWKWRG